MYATFNKFYCGTDWWVPPSDLSVYANSLLVTYVYPHFQNVRICLKFFGKHQGWTRERRSAAPHQKDGKTSLFVSMGWKIICAATQMGPTNWRWVYQWSCRGMTPHSLGIYRLIWEALMIQRDQLFILRYRPWVLSLFDSDRLNPIAHRWRLMSSGVSTISSPQDDDANRYSRLHIIHHNSYSTTKICDIVRMLRAAWLAVQILCLSAGLTESIKTIIAYLWQTDEKIWIKLSSES